MFHIRNHKQLNIFDLWGHLEPKRRKLFDNSWAEVVSTENTPQFAGGDSVSHYHEWNGRPSKELYSMMGLMVLQQMHDLTDDEAVEQLCFIKLVAKKQRVAENPINESTA